MNPDTDNSRRLRIILAVMPQSPFNRSIWTGFLEGFQSLGHTVQVLDSAQIPEPDNNKNPVDLLFAVHGFHVPADTVRAYRAAGTTTAVYLLDEPYEVDRTVEWASRFDCAFSVDRITVPVHQQNTQAEYLPLAYNPSLFSPNGPSIPSRILVLGTPFSAREQYLAALRDRWGELVTWVGPGWKKFSTPGQHYEQYASPSDCARFYRGADIAINIHRDSTWSHFGELNKNRLEATHLNPRFWETAACNSLQLCSYRSDLGIFAPKCPTFKTVGEFTNKVEYFLGKDKARKDNAKRVYDKIKNHTYKARCATVLDFLTFTLH